MLHHSTAILVAFTSATDKIRQPPVQGVVQNPKTSLIHTSPQLSCTYLGQTEGDRHGKVQMQAWKPAEAQTI